MNEFRNNTSHESNERSAGLVIPARFFGWVVAAVCAIAFMVFMSGYFWGKKSAFETFCKNTEKNSLADHIYVALCGAPEYKETVAAQEMDEVVDEQETAVSNSDTEINALQDVQVAKTEVVVEPAITESSTQQLSQLSSQNNDLQQKFHAELIGFGSLQGAKRFASRLEKKQIPVVINKRVSKTAKGRVVTWYQVVTAHYKNENELIALVNTLKQQERLNDVRIVASTDTAV